MAHESFEDQDVARAAQRGLRGGQGGPRGTSGHRRRLHVGHDRADRSRWLADDLRPHSRRRPVLRRHLLPQGPVPPAPRGGQATPGPRSASGCSTAGPTSRRRLRELSAPVTGRVLDAAALDAAVVQLRGQFDHGAAGFGGAPKFPPSMVLEFLLRHHARTGSADALAMAASTCEAMARGGHLRPARRRLRALLRRRPLGGPALREDALRQRPAAAGLHPPAPRDGLPAGPTGRTGDGRVPAARPAHRRGRLRLGPRRGHRRGRGPDLRVDARPARRGARRGRRSPGPRPCSRSPTAGPSSTAPPRSSCWPTPTTSAWWAAARGRLLDARGQRPQPGRDDKVVTSWNGLAIAALADAGTLFERPELVEAARHVRRVRRRHPRRGRPTAAHLPGRSVGAAAGVADDYGNLAEGLLALHQATGDARWLAAAGDLLATAVERFGADDGGFHDTSDDAEALFTRPRSAADNAEPSGQSALAGALLDLLGPHRRPGDARAGRGRPRRVGAARRPGRPLRRLGAGGGRGSPGRAPPGRPGRDRARGAEPSLTAARRSPSPGLVLVHGEPDAPGIPLLAQRPLVGGHAAAYVCRGFVCDAPVTDVAALTAALGR